MFEIFKSEKNNKYYFNLKAKNGQIILSSQAYESKAGVENGISSVKENADDDSKYERKTASNGKFHFNLKAGNGQVIGSSQMYASEAGMENGIDSVKTNAPDASVKDITE
ncbi:YegP family protein [Abyssalbus ytuae]|uniref:YegP family protein n=1 Tax=Abyssalbus ytuae TaxID=2926907 RepID=A0A9E6ZKG6_9FLAO|nr:YegP family protein [Abyssalbus ytuae]UOB17354.1 YegP family protein [Abyssalbus ytuae]